MPVRVSVVPVESVGGELQGARDYQGYQGVRDDRGGREYYGANR